MKAPRQDESINRTGICSVWPYRLARLGWSPGHGWTGRHDISLTRSSHADRWYVEIALLQRRHS